jgi:hypothetical protein
MNTNSRLSLVLFIVTGCVTLANAQQAAPAGMETCPLHAQHQAEKAKQAAHNHLAAVNQRGEQAMGFSQTETTHHFRLYADGGAIEVLANSTQDIASREQIRQHLQQIAQLFAKGDFAKPQHTHAQVPPGVTEMTRLKTDISYQYESLPSGGRVRIKTANPDALKAVYEFLRFQIKDHQTGDANTVQP